MQNSLVVFNFSVLDRKHPFWQTRVTEARLLSLRTYERGGFEIGSCCQHGFFILLRWVRLWIVSGHCLKNFLNDLKRKQTFYFTWINFLLKKLNCQILFELFFVTWINLLLMKHKLINYDWIVNNLELVSAIFN